MEPRFGHDFSRVRIHDGEEANAAATELGARAFTIGDNIAFRRGEFDPHSAQGAHLVAHELAHTLQQADSGVSASRFADAQSEHAAEQMAVEVLSGGTVGKPAQTGVCIARETERRQLSLAEQGAIILKGLSASLADAERRREDNISFTVTNTGTALTTDDTLQSTPRPDSHDTRAMNELSSFIDWAASSPGRHRIVFQRRGDRLVAEAWSQGAVTPPPKPSGDRTAQLDELEADVARLDFLKQNYADLSIETLKIAIPTSPLDVAVSAVVPFSPRLFKALRNALRLGKIKEIARLPVRVAQLARQTTKTAKIDARLLQEAWKYRYGVGAAEEAFYRNFMSARINVDGEIHYLTALNVPDSAWHSESHLLDLVHEIRTKSGGAKNVRVEQVLTERIPCANCTRMLDEQFSDTQIFYFVGKDANRAESLFEKYYDPHRLMSGFHE